MKTSMYDLFLSRADGTHIEAWQIGDQTVSEDEARRRLSAIELSSEDWVNPKGASRRIGRRSTLRGSGRRLGPPSGSSSPSAHTRAACGSTAPRATRPPARATPTSRQWGPSMAEKTERRNPGLEIRGPFKIDPMLGMRNGVGRCALSWPTSAEEQVILQALNRAWRKQERERAAGRQS